MQNNHPGLLVAFALGLATSTNLWAADNYSPFTKAWPTTPLKCSAQTPGLGGGNVTVTCRLGRTTVMLTPGTSKSTVTIEYNKKTRATLLGQVCHFYTHAQTGDFNQDGKADALLNFNCGGNGLAALNMHAVFILSQEKDHRVMSLYTMEPATVISKNGKPMFVHKQVVSAKSRKFKRYHHFWVYHLFRFKGDRLVRAKHQSSWVQYTAKPSRRQTRLLTRNEKSAAWKEHIKRIGFNPLNVDYAVR